MRYIGVTANSINTRYSYKASTHHFSTCYHESPQDFQFQIIPCETMELAFELEELIVDMEVVNSPMFYNKTLGGGKYPVFTEETKANLSKALTGRVFTDEHKAKISAAQTGRICTPETKAKLKKSAGRKKGFTMSDEHKAKISAANKGRPKAKRSPEHTAKIVATQAANRLVKSISLMP